APLASRSNGLAADRTAASGAGKPVPIAQFAPKRPVHIEAYGSALDSWPGRKLRGCRALGRARKTGTGPRRSPAPPQRAVSWVGGVKRGPVGAKWEGRATATVNLVRGR